VNAAPRGSASRRYTPVGVTGPSVNHLTSRRVLVIAAAILTVALGIRVGYVLATPGYVPSHDDRAYDHLALGIAQNGAYPDLGHRATAYRPPGYTYSLGAVYAIAGAGHARITAARIVQAFLGTGIVALLGLLALRLFSRRAALYTMAIAALYPPLIAVGVSLLSEPQTVALELASILAVLSWRSTGRWRWVLLAGALGGALALTRSNAFVVVLALAAGVWTVRPRVSAAAIKPVAALLATAVLVVAPWTIRNAVVLHSFIPVSDEQGGTLAGTYNPVSDHDKSAPAYWHLLTQIPQYEAATRQLADGPEPQFQDRLLHLALDYIGDHPLYPAKVAFWNTVRLLDLNALSQSRYTATLGGITSPGVGDATIYGFWVVAAVALYACLRRDIRQRVPAFVWLAALLLFLSTVLVNSETPRLRLPLDPFIILLAGAGTAAITERRRQLRQP